MTKKEHSKDDGLIKTAVIVLNWNGWQDTIECLESIFQINYLNYQVIVVDNGSSDGSIEKIKQWADGKIAVDSKYFKYSSENKPLSYLEIDLVSPSTIKEHVPLILVKLKENIGFARGNNVGIKYALLDENVKYVLTINNDTVVTPKFLQILVSGFDIEGRSALIMPKIGDYSTGQFYWPPALRRFGFIAYLLSFTPLNRFFSPLRSFINLLFNKITVPTKIYALGGVCMLFKRQVLEEIGLFDEKTFLGWEEFIIAEKLLKRGYNTFFMPGSVIYHKIGQDTKRIEPVEKVITFLKSENYFQDNYFKMPAVQRFMIRLTRLVFYSVQSLFNSSYRKSYIRVAKAMFGDNN